MTAAFSMPLHEPRPIKPVSNDDHQLIVEPREDGSWCLRFDGDPVDKRMGHFPDAGAAETAARRCCTNVRPPHPQAQQEATLRDVGKRLHDLTHDSANPRLRRFETK